MQAASFVRLHRCIVVANLAKNRVLACPDVFGEEEGHFSVEEDCGADWIHDAKRDSLVLALKIGQKIAGGVVIVQPVDGESHLHGVIDIVRADCNPKPPAYQSKR